MPKITLKAIKPKRKQQRGAISPVAINKGLKRTATGLKRDFNDTVRTWDKKPTFTITIRADRVEGATDDKIWGYLNDGTPAHIIHAKKPNGRLAFRLGGSAKTSPNIIRSGAGSAANGPLKRPRSVRHPGIKARNWTKVIAKRRALTLKQEISHAMAEIARNGG